jgi:hydrogenase nickel incorporation protein HypA/HybF
MHEMSIAESIAQIAEDAAAQDGNSRITRVFVEIGELAGVEVEALRFCWEAVTREGAAAGAELAISRTAGHGWCLQCAETVPLPALYEPCPRCGGYQIEVTGGKEMRVKEIEVE